MSNLMKKNISYLINLIILIFIYFRFFYKKWKKEPKEILIVNTLMYIYIIMVLFVTLMPLTIPLGGTNNLFMETANFIPFRDLRLNYGGAVREIFLNIVMMMPFGFLYPIIKKKKLLNTVFMTLLFSLSIECFQLLNVWWGTGWSSRTFDVTDLITNTLGGLVGYLFFIVLKKPISKILSIDRNCVI